ncbi:molybdopterin-synthase adenylyltransferase MoeB [Hymenobacter sp. BT770]|uniref:molybdopterin-synthase adenylyltransferase MoeB n=1 Tax=Hymenobacter sp. BT770 TaxID=2886942 RepID=UPI001D1203F7|nr:molybdopterin-synthase adenylyltransferase MoeB [Hymenobacter sp. BT770]MCC3151769.1 molybdopterin-synthase adenylyltransferase MoeB [Hymenobacter sp. BT770]MDO3413609.1 molybdopterin-synthase adenylyltransferase MoeB [Hymenobacter sp. BT770]
MSPAEASFSAAETNRYSRHLLLPEIGLAGQLKLKAAKVLVVGCGGLGCPVLQYLAAAGVGTLGLLDFDTVDDSNLQRQVLYATADVGRPKAVVAAEKLAAQNPFIELRTHQLHLSADNALGLFADYDLVVDCSDNFATRYLVNDACVILGKPLVFGAIFKFEGQVSVFNYENGPTYRCLYPEPPAPGDAPSCAEIGVLGVLPGLVGTLQAAEALKIILELGEVLSGRLLMVDALGMQFQTIRFRAVAANQQLTALAPDYAAFCGEAPMVAAPGRAPEISADELKAWQQSGRSLQLLDVREPHEHAQRNIGGQLLPLGQLADKLAEIAADTPVVVHCASGIRSQKAAQLLLAHGFAEVYSLRNGLADY